jgi:ATP-binding cassette subfamily B protein
MSLPAALDLLSGFQPFAGLPAHEQSRLAALLRPVQLRTGTRLHDFSELPPAVVLLQEGQLRVLAQDSRGESYTLERVAAGMFTGWLPLLRGVPGQVVAAAQPSRAWLLPADDFLELHRRHEAVREFCRQGGAIELMAVAAADSRPDLLRDAALRDWARQIPAQPALLLDGPRARVPEGHWLLSSAAVEDQPVGIALEGGAELQVKGLLPARLLPRPEAWPPVPVASSEALEPSDPDATAGPLAAASAPPEVIEPEWVDGSDLVPQLRQAEALQDWYGRLGDDGSFPQVEGSGPLEEPFACLRMLARSFDLPFRRDIVRRILEDQLQRSEGKGITQLQLAAVCDLLGLSASLLEVDPAQVHRLPTPAVLMQDAAHPVVLWSVEGGSLLLGDPRQGQRRVARGQLAPFLGENGRLPVLCLQRSSATPKARFGLAWFLPAIRQHRGILTQVLVASFFVQLFALLNPLLIQQIIDAVISQGNLRSLNVLGTLLVAMAIAEALLGSLRTYLFSDTTNRIDISLGSSIIDHLLRLPLGYFARRPVGEVASRINELERIRRFLTGTALTVVLDAVFSVIYIAVMLLYSPVLTLWALAVVPFFIGLTAAAAPIIRRQLREQAEANARVQSHLVETLGGMETVKGQGMELHSRWRWQQLYGGQIAAGFRNTVTSTAAGSASHFFEQLSGLLVLWVGAGLVLQGKLTLGQLIAFRILSGYVTSPLLRLATLWQNFQETALSLERLSDIVDHPQELEIAGSQLPPLPPVQGAIRYERVNFRFGSGGPLQLVNVDVDIPAGSFIGIVGSSGSGKSTLLKLLTRLYDPLEGTIRVDGYDIAKVDLYSLRRQIGVVPQDSLLFDGTVQENIALTRPDADFEEIMAAAQVACAHDFIQQLPAGYSTSVGERGSGLSGGQRQRLAIARMVLKQPRLLVLDEATSALDVDTEQQLTRNLSQAYRGRTVLFITHRLGTLRHADRIIVMHEGAVAEQGSHEQLLALGGRYATLFRQQESALA